MTIDAHVHLWNRAVDPQDWIDPATMSEIARDFGAGDLVEMLDASGAEAAVVVQASNSAGETGRLLALDEPRIAGVVGWVDLTRDVPAQLAALAGSPRPLVGIRHLTHIDPDPEWLGRPEVGAGLEALGAAGLGFDLVLRAAQLGLAARVAGERPGTRFVLDHLGGIAEAEVAAWEPGFRAIARQANVVAKLSGLWRMAADPAALDRIVDVALEAFGPDRLMYGSDWPLVRMGGDAAGWRALVDAALAPLSADERADVLTGTATRHYRLSR
ncbi:amidohydrolase family protein [Pseudolysinimonas sp.]|uniref:amidohydrolase family protein n=1 Tax=Pseudolysinimonas sp. TaxID=2680009 RepID=UPI003F7EBA79